MDLHKYLDLFVSEAGEHVQAAGDAIARWSAAPQAPGPLNALFRHFHSIKGMAASMGFERIASLSHAVEDLFDRLRRDDSAPPGGTADLVMEALDCTAAMIAEAAQAGPGAPLPTDPTPIIERIRALLPAPASVQTRREDAPGAPPTPAAPATPRRLFQCVVTIDPRADLAGPRAALVLRRLEQAGRILQTEPPREALARPDFDGRVRLRLATDRGEPELREAVRGLTDLQGFEVQEEPSGEARPAAAGAPAEAAGPATLRLPVATLDLLLDAIAEMITRRGALAEAIKRRDLPATGAALAKMSESLDRLRDQVMQIRLLPFEQITAQLMRTVRDLCRRTGKRVRLQVAGEQVCLDRSVLQEIVDPLTHLIRNAVDHGIAAPPEREAAGKPSTGAIRIEVTRAGDHVLLAVEDDGRGMDPDAIRRTALAGGFATEADLAAMDPQEVLMLTTVPGFSTRGSVTDISGRGVGMDVVRTRIEALGGHMRIRSRRGSGTRIEMTLPISVAVIDAFLVECRARLFAIPASSVLGVQQVEARRVRSTLSGAVPQADAGSAGAAGSGLLTPLVSLDEALGLAGSGAAAGPGEATGSLPAVAYEVDGARGLMAVDRILQRRELLAKPLGAPLEHLRKYSGAALLDDGRIALILDLANLRG